LSSIAMTSLTGCMWRAWSLCLAHISIYHKYNYLIVFSRKQTTTHHHSHSLYYIWLKTKKVGR
jgi:hypothetical protein